MTCRRGDTRSARGVVQFPVEDGHGSLAAAAFENGFTFMTQRLRRFAALVPLVVTIRIFFVQFQLDGLER
jgi:hypothetical protein